MQMDVLKVDLHAVRRKPKGVLVELFEAMKQMEVGDGVEAPSYAGGVCSHISLWDEKRAFGTRVVNGKRYIVRLK